MSKELTNKPAAWIGSLSAYNNGTLLGAWFDWDEIPESPRDWVEALIEQGVIVPGARTIDDLALEHEEIVGMDHENYAGLFEGEPDTLTLAAAAAVIREAIDKGHTLEEVVAYCEIAGESPLELTSQEAMADALRGEWGSSAEYLEELMRSCWEGVIPEDVLGYIDWERMARDEEMGGGAHFERVTHDRTRVWVI